MNAIRKTSWALVRDQSGATAVEYALIASLIMMAAIGGLTALGGGASGMWGNIEAQVVAAMG